VKALTDCFTEQFEIQLHVKRRAYSDIHHVNRSHEEFTAKHFANATYNLFSCHSNISMDDSRQLCRELRSLANCFSKQFKVQTGARTSCSSLRVEKRAYSETAGIGAEQQLSYKLARCQDRVGSWHTQDTKNKVEAGHQVLDHKGYGNSNGLDMGVSSHLRNNRFLCSGNEAVCKGRAPPPAVSTRNLPCLQPATHSKMGVESAVGPKKAVPSIQP
jgi:hypothetical protein